MKTTFYSLPVDYFLWNEESANKQKLVYYDENGEAHEKEVPKDKLEKALKFFDGKLYSIARTNGGIVNGEPYELVICENSRSPLLKEMEPEVRIGLKFTDLKRDRTRMVVSNEVIYHTKYVTPEELGPAIDWTLGVEQKYVLEFGRGLIPIRLLQFSKGISGTDAVFVREDELASISLKAAGTETSLSVYQVPKDVLRKARPLFGGRSSEFEVAKDNVNWLNQTGDTVVPQILKVAEVTLKAGYRVETQLKILQKKLIAETHSENRNKKGVEKLDPLRSL